MNESSDVPERPVPDRAAHARAPATSAVRASVGRPAVAPRLALVSAAPRGVGPAQDAPDAWRSAIGDLLGWLGVDAAVVPPDPGFAPWTGWSPTAFQNGGSTALPAAQFAASYCFDHARASAGPRRGPVDVMLISPHPECCIDAAGAPAALPPVDVLRMMIRGALAEGRKRIAIIVPARHLAAVRGLGLAEDPALSSPDVILDIRTGEDALPALMARPAAWDAIIAMPDLRGMVFAMLAETSGVCGPWPMTWHANGLRQVTSEAIVIGGDDRAALPLDASALVLGLALRLRASGCHHAALRLFEGWARLRDSGVTTQRRGDDAPYATAVSDAEFIALICRNSAASRKAQPPWRALKNQQKLIFGTQKPDLRIVPANLADPEHRGCFHAEPHNRSE